MMSKFAKTTMKTNKSIELFLFSKDHKISYVGYCKITLDAINKVLIVSSESNDSIKVKFTDNYFKYNNILNVRSLEENGFNFTLIFKNKSACSKVFDIINRFKTLENRNAAESQLETFIHIFLLPVFEKIKGTKEERMKQIITDFLAILDGSEKASILRFMEENNVHDLVFPIDNNQGECNLRKRPFKAINYEEQSDPESNNSPSKHEHKTLKLELKDEEDGKEKLFYYIAHGKTNHKPTPDQIVFSPNFKLIHVRRNGIPKPKLLVFISSQNCYEYGWSLERKVFYCSGCRVLKKDRTRASIRQDKDGVAYVQLGNSIHVCEPREYWPEKFENKDILKKPDYKIVEKEINGEIKRRLYVINQYHRELCYEYYWDIKMKLFWCVSCSRTTLNVTAKVYNEGNEEEYIELCRNEHLCKLRPLNLQYFEPKEKRTILSPDFKIVETNEKKHLIIFDPENKSKCYKYVYQPKKNYICTPCNNRNKHVSAKLCINENGETFIELNDQDHVCQLLDYEEDVIIEALDFEYKDLKNSNPKILVFIDINRSKYYEFIGIKYKGKKVERFICNGCTKIAKRKTTDPIAKILLCKKENDEKYLKMLISSHCCEPKDYIPEEETIIKSPNFLFYRTIDQRQPKLIIFQNDKRAMCYSFSLPNPKCNEYICYECRANGKEIRARVGKNESDGSDYIIMESTKHVCKPKNYQSFLKNRIQVLKESNSMEPEKLTIKADDFEFRGETFKYPKYLVVYDSKDRHLCYEYAHNAYQGFYVCTKCKEMGKRLVAKLKKNNKSEWYLELESSEHFCKPQKYQPLKNIVEDPNFKIFKYDQGNANSKLVIFTTSNHELCYEYTFAPSRTSYICYTCQGKNKIVTSKILHKPNGNEYVQLSDVPHICEPKKFIEANYYQKTRTSNFQLLFNTRGAADKRLIIFDNKNQNSRYEYLTTQTGGFDCMKCRYEKAVPAKITKDEAGNTIVEYALEKHICTIRDFFIEERLIYAPNFQVLKDKNGKEKIMSIHPKDKKLHYEYIFDETRKFFRCIECENRKKLVIPKICTNEKSEYLFLNSFHFCKALPNNKE